MKPFKFRVWDSINKEFCTPDDFYTSCYGEVYKKIMCSDRIIHQNNARYEISYSTGLFDIEGAEIFEGDILNYYKNSKSLIQIVYFDEKLSKFMQKELFRISVDSKYKILTTSDLRNCHKKCIISNKYENKELLENL